MKQEYFLNLTFFYLNGEKLKEMLATHQEKLFEVLLYVLVLNSEHGSSQPVDSCSQTVDVVVVAWKKSKTLKNIKNRVLSCNFSYKDDVFMAPTTLMIRNT